MIRYNGMDLSEADVIRIAKRVRNGSEPAVLSVEEQGLINDYRLLDRRSQMKVLKFIAKILDNKFMGDD